MAAILDFENFEKFFEGTYQTIYHTTFYKKLLIFNKL